MFLKLYGIILCLAPTAIVVNAQCIPDNCLRALRSPSNINQARIDCMPWLITTVVPEPVTETEYSTIESTSSVTASVTLENTIEQTATITASLTSTVTVSVTATISSSLRPNGLKARTAEPVVPTYASACSVPARFTSACSCISATPVTTTAIPSTITTTIPTTIWTTETETHLTTNDISATVATVSATTVVATTTVTTTVATQTVYPFFLTINDSYGLWYLYVVNNNENIIVTQDSSKAQKFELRSDGRIWAGNRYFGRYTSSGIQFIRVFPPNYPGGPGTVFQCSVSPNYELNCQIPGSAANKWATQIWKQGNAWVRFSGSGVFHGTQAEITSTSSNTFTPVVLKVIPAA